MQHLIRPFTTEDIPRFLQLADAEEWIVLPWEIPFLLESFPDGCLCWVDDSGEKRGFVTASVHRRSGWIGNLVVDRDHRGAGIGSRLFDRALSALRARGVSTIWLTASPAGKTIYEKRGFQEIDRVIRFIGRGGTPPPLPTDPMQTVPPDIPKIDGQGWGDDRSTLIGRCIDNGTLISRGDGFLLIQGFGDRFQVGPWGSQSQEGGEMLLRMGMGRIGNTNFFIDTLAANSSSMNLLFRTGLRAVGENSLMYLGDPPAWNPRLIYGLATMGSSG